MLSVNLRLQLDAFILCLQMVLTDHDSVTSSYAADSAAFKQCQQIKPHGKFGPMKQKKNCFRDYSTEH